MGGAEMSELSNSAVTAAVDEQVRAYINSILQALGSREPLTGLAGDPPGPGRAEDGAGGASGGAPPGRGGPQPGAGRHPGETGEVVGAAGGAASGRLGAGRGFPVPHDPDPRPARAARV